jgi:DNA-binding CsgD family transcriptional regulator
VGAWVRNDLSLWVTLHTGDGPIDGTVRSAAAGEVTFAGWLGLVAAVRTVVARELGRAQAQPGTDRIRGREAAPGTIRDELEAVGPLGAGDAAGAIEALEKILRSDEPWSDPFERARLLLALGRARRRAKQRKQAREALVEALEIFEQTGPPEWVETARVELARCGVRAADGELTVSERRVAELVAEGMSNREIAAAAFISPKTVEANLARIYRKLGIRSRAQLAIYITCGSMTGEHDTAANFTE